MGGAWRSKRPAAVPQASGDVRQPAVAPASWRDRLRHAVDLTVAFVTLEDAEPEHHDPGDAPPSHVFVDGRHPHRKPLRPMPRPRRPGAAAARPQVCTAPVGRTAATPPKRRARY
jgi:hypothetical protein